MTISIIFIYKNSKLIEYTEIHLWSNPLFYRKNWYMRKKYGRFFSYYCDKNLPSDYSFPEKPTPRCFPFIKKCLLAALFEIFARQAFFAILRNARESELEYELL